MKVSVKKLALYCGLGLLILAGCDLPEESANGTGSMVEKPKVEEVELAPIAVVSEGESAYFEESDQMLAQPFLGFWEENGGLAVFGYPISERMIEKDEVTGVEYTAKYFERARLELHPETGDKVVVGRLGALVQAPEPRVKAKKGMHFFKETGHNVSNKYFEFWNSHGGLVALGYPITEERVEVNPAEGKEYTVQYFERSRFELHPEFAGTPYEVQLGQLGAQVYAQKYPTQAER